MPAVQAPTDLALLSDFFDRYGAALTSGDVAAVAGCYALPGMVVADSYSFTFTSPAAVALSFLLAGSVGGEGAQSTEPGALRDAPPELGDAADRTQPTGRLPHQGQVHQTVDGGGHGLR